MDQNELLGWVKDNSALLSPEEIDHVAMCCHHIQRWYHEGYPLGGFLTAVTRNDFVGACLNADAVNIKALRIYALFLMWHLPADWRKKAKGGG